MTMNVDLTPELEALVRDKVNSGLYGSASEVVRAALRLLEEQDRARALHLAQLRRDIQDGIDSGPAGEIDIEAIKRRGRTRLKALASRKPRSAEAAVAKG